MLHEYLQRLLLIAPPILLALTVHECGHAYVADRMGDPTAKMLGRITLNPLKHLDPIGTLVLFLSGMFGWAKPVPINPRNFKDVSRSLILVSLAGPLANLTLAAFFAIVHKLFVVLAPHFAYVMPGVYKPLFIMVDLSILINVSLAIFNLLPVPPLDGSKVLSNMLPPTKAFAFSRLEPYGFLILILLISTGFIGRFISPIVFFMVGILTGGSF